MDRIPDRIDSNFRFVLLAATRAEQMMRGAVPRVELPAAKPTRVGMEEILRDSVAWDYGPAPEPVADEVADEDDLGFETH